MELYTHNFIITLCLFTHSFLRLAVCLKCIVGILFLPSQCSHMLSVDVQCQSTYYPHRILAHSGASPIQLLHINYFTALFLILLFWHTQELQKIFLFSTCISTVYIGDWNYKFDFITSFNNTKTQVECICQNQTSYSRALRSLLYTQYSYFALKSL